MKLDRNVNADGRGKYALLKLRRQEKPFPPELQECAEKLKAAGLLEFGPPESSQFFVIKYTDRFAALTLWDYRAHILDYCQYLPDGSDERASLLEYAADICEEAKYAESLPVKTPD